MADPSYALPAQGLDMIQELLRQAGMSMLFYEPTAGGVVFVDLDAALKRMRAPRANQSEE